MKIRLLIILLLLNGCLLAQYRVGDTASDLVLGSQLFKPVKPVRLSQLKSPLILLDFMTTYCPPCIKALPHYDSMQAELKEKARIIILINSPKKQAEDFIKKLGFTKYTNLTFIAMDRSMIKDFNITSTPYFVWIAQGNKIKAITSSEYVRIPNLLQLGKGKGAEDWPDISIPEDEPFINLGQLQNAAKKNTSYSIISGFRNRKNITSAAEFKIDSALNAQYWILANISIPNMYKTAMFDISTEELKPNRFIFQVKDSARFYYDPARGYKEKWRRENTISYEALLPLNTTSRQRHQKLLLDLNISLGLNGRTEYREMDCWLIKIKSADSLRPAQINYQALTDSKAYKFETIKDLLAAFNDVPNHDIVIAQEQYEWSQPLYFNSSQLKNMEEFNKKLNQYGFEIINTRQTLEVFILTE